MAIFHCVTEFEMKEIQEGLWQLTKYNGIPYANIEIPSCIDGKKIISLGERLFSGADFLKSVKISEGIKRIENNAFYLSEVSHVEFPQSLEHIADEAFYWSNVEKIFIPRNVKHLGERAFNTLVEAKIEDGCTVPLTSMGALRPLEVFYIPESITEISEDIFWTAIALPSTQEAVKDEAGKIVRNAWGEVVTHKVHHSTSAVRIPTNLTICCNGNSAAYAFAKQHEIKIAEYSDDSLYNDVLYVDYFSDVTSITIPANIRIVKKARRVSWLNLTSIVFEEGSNLEVIEEGTFENAPILKSVTFPKSLKRIERNAFYNCRELSHISFDACDNLEFIGERAFSKCGTMGYIDTISLPASVKKLGEYVFSQSTIKSVDFRKSVLLAEISKGAFSSCQHLTKVLLPKAGSIKIIREAAFAGTNIKEFNFAGVEYIGQGAFVKCYYLKTVTIPTECEEYEAFGTTLSGTPITVIRKDMSNLETESAYSDDFVDQIYNKTKQLLGKVKNLFK